MVSTERGLKNAAMPVPLRPNTSLVREPSIMIELKRLFWPTAVMWASSRSLALEREFRVTMGLALTRSANERSAVGLPSRRSLSRVEPAPLAVASRSPLPPVVTNFSSCSTSGLSFRGTEMSLPSSVMTSVTGSPEKPVADARML